MNENTNLKEELDIAFARSLRYLSFRPRSEKELSDFLNKKNLKPQIIQAVIERLKKEKLLGDEDFVKWWIEQRQEFKHKSKFFIKQELLQKGVDKTIIEKHLQESAEDDSVAARVLFNKALRRFEGLPEIEFKKKMTEYLYRRGHQFSVINELIKEYYTKQK